LSVFPSPARWLPDATPTLNKLIVTRAILDVGLLEEPPGSNHSPTIDGYLTAVGSPLGSAWCAAAVSAWFRDAGAAYPHSAAGSCAMWYEVGLDTGMLSHVPAPGCAVLYDFSGDGHADHMGVVVRTDPLILSVEANTTLPRQTGNEREGVACVLKLVDTAHVLSYFHPSPNGASLP